MPEPDLAVVDGRDSDYRHSHPSTARMVVEIAVTSLGLDREKATLYAEAGVPEYWLVVAAGEMVEVYSSPENATYTRQQGYCRGDTIISAVLPRLRVDVDGLFGR